MTMSVPYIQKKSMTLDIETHVTYMAGGGEYSRRSTVARAILYDVHPGNQFHSVFVVVW